MPEQIKTTLFLNYERQINRPWETKQFGDIGTTWDTNFTRRISEILVPAAGGDGGSIADAISNGIYVEARRANMSLSGYGHLDPFKFCVANTFLGNLMGEARRAMGIACHYEFGNIHTGRVLLRAAGFSFNDIVNNYAEYAARYNRLVARINNLMIPSLKLFKKWLRHRTVVFKDDEGDRYSLYLYRMKNIYKLDVDASSDTVGQLVFIDLDQHFGSTDNIKLSDYFTYIENLVAEYESDDDLVNFSTEAIKAGMGHLVIDPIPSTNDNFAKVDVTFDYDLDDIQSLENLRVVHPINGTASLNFAGVQVSCTMNWNIMENPDTNKLMIGYINFGVSGFQIERGLLPIAIPLNVSDSTSISYSTSFRVQDSPIITHAKIKSEEGLQSLTRYIVGSVHDDHVALELGTLAALTGLSQFHITTDISTSHNMSSTIYGSTAAGKAKAVHVLDTYGTEMVNDITCFTMTGKETAKVIMNILYKGDSASAANVLYTWNALMVGFKARIALYSYLTGAFVPVICDYDYLTSVTDDSLRNFHIANAWNYCQID